MDLFKDDVTPDNELVLSDINFISYSELIESEVFIGVMPLQPLLEGINNQFRNYVNNNDMIDYVNLFYTQLNDSYNEIKNNQDEEHIVEKREVLDKIYNSFIDTMRKLFDLYLTITITDLESDDNTDPDNIQYCIRKIYECFILNANKNFKTALTIDVNNKLEKGLNEDEIFTQINIILDDHSPLINMLPDTFLKFSNNQDITDLFENNSIAGNFLRKYTPKLYVNESFKVSLINNIILYYQLQDDLITMNREILIKKLEEDTYNG